MKISKIAVISLGCDKNRVDTENMLHYLCDKGLVVVNDYSLADVIIVNTCAFIESARIEAIETILQMAEHKKQNCKRLIVTGCLPQKYLNEIKDELPEVDAFLGTNEYEKIVGAVFGDSGICPISDHKRVLTTPSHYAYLKIADGCNNHCTFCTIPSIRGAYRSRDIASLKQEAQDLAERGVQELILVAQDVTNYGADLYGKQSLVELLKALEQTDIRYIRLMYCYPESVSDALIEYISGSSKVIHYMDIPLQHISDNVLKSMGRRSRHDSICALLDRLYAAIPDIYIRTTVMVGFPGETESDFQSLCEFIVKYKPHHLGVFAYSREEGTPSYAYKNQVAKAIKRKRVNIIGKLNLSNTVGRNKGLIGQTVDVIYEDIDYEKGLFVGRTLADAPEIDGKVFFTGKFADVGHIYKVKITDYDEYDLIGEMEQDDITE